MEAGKELDALIYEKVMGKSAFPIRNGIGTYDVFPILAYSTDIAAAWKLHEHMLTMPSEIVKKYFEYGPESFGAHAIAPGETARHFGDTATPLEICTAALKACGVEI